MTTLAQIEKIHQHNLSMLEQIRDTLIEMNRTRKQLECSHSFEDPESSTCFNCGIDMYF